MHTAPAVAAPYPCFKDINTSRNHIFSDSLASALDVFISEYLGVFQVSLYY